MDTGSFLTSNEIPIRLGFFFGIFIVMAAWEHLAPRRTLTLSKLKRWVNNLGLVFLNSLILRLLFPIAAVGMAVFAEQRGWGMFNYFDLPALAVVPLTFIIMDLIIYLQHVMMHAVPLFWRLHRVHHADIDFDVTTGTRFHPIEIILSMLIKFAIIVLLGAPVAAVIIFEVVLNATAMFNHSNVRIPKRIDRIMRYLIVTPDMHRVHHSIAADEINSNFCFNLPWWDRLFGTYREQPRAGHEGMTIGFQQADHLEVVDTLPAMLAFPFIEKNDRYSINRRKKQ